MRSIAVALFVAAFAACSAAALDEGADDSAAAGDDALTTSVPIDSTLIATQNVNLRAGASTNTSIMLVIPKGATMKAVASSPSNGFYEVTYESRTGWVYGAYLKAVTAASTGVAKIRSITDASTCASYSWKSRGTATKGYTAGVALVFARAVCALDRSDVAVVKQANTGDDKRDALSWYDSNFASAGMSNSTSSVTTLRHAYTLLLGLGMRESSGQHCIGRDASATNTTSDSAEAGAWQTSWDSRSNSPELAKLLAKYKGTSSGCFLEVFSSGVTCGAADWRNWGSGSDGVEFQRLSKECPGFAAEYAAVMLRVSGGSGGHYGPLRTKAAELRPECDAMLAKVQTAVEQDPSLCSSL